MPAIVRVQDVVAPAHCSGVVNGVVEATKVNTDVVQGVGGAPAPAHKRRLVGTPGAEIDSPAFPIGLVRGMAMQMLPLLHVDASDFVTLHLRVPWGAPHERSTGCTRAEVLTLVEADTIGVCFDETKGIALGGDRCPLDSTVLQLLSVGAFARGSSPNVQIEFLHDNSGSLGLGY